MIRTNLATRPFYNERIVGMWLSAALVAVVLASVFNVTRVIGYSHSDTELGTQASRDEARARELRETAARQRSTVDPKQFEFASTEARQANDLIDRRTFSWTELFNLFETTLPDDARVTSVRPRIERGQFVLGISIVAKAVADVGAFMDSLENSGAFSEVGSRVDEHFNEQGEVEASFQAVYTPMAGTTGGGGQR